MLTEIRISPFTNTAGTRTLQLNKSLEICGKSLESLTFTGLILVYPPLTASNTPPSVYHRIKKLDFVTMSLPHDIDTFISSSFPELHALKFKKCSDTKKEKRYFMLPNTNLHYLQVLHGLDTDDHVLVLTLCNNKKRMYKSARGAYDFYTHEVNFGLQDAATNPSIISVPFENRPVSPFLTIICNSLKDILLFGN
jgi:hypothetical protein